MDEEIIIDGLKDNFKVPLSAKVSPKIRDCFDIMMKPMDDEDQRTTADKCMESFFDKDLNSKFSSDRMRNYIKKKLFYPVVEMGLKIKLEKIIDSLENCDKSKIDKKIDEAIAKVYKEKDAAVIDAEETIIDIFRLGEDETYRFVLEKIIRDENGEYDVFKEIESTANYAIQKIEFWKKSKNLNKNNEKQGGFYKKLEETNKEFRNISIYYFENSEKDFNRLVDYMLYLKKKNAYENVNVFNIDASNVFKIAISSINEKLLRGIANITQNNDIDIIQKAECMLTSWPLTNELIDRFKMERYKIGEVVVTLKDFMLNNYEVDTFEEMYALFDAFNSYYLELYAFLANFIGYRTK